MYPTSSKHEHQTIIFLKGHRRTLTQGMARELVRKLYNGRHRLKLPLNHGMTQKSLGQHDSIEDQ